MSILLDALILEPRRRRAAEESQTAFNTALGSFTKTAPGKQGPPLPGSESGMQLNPTQAAGLERAYAANPQLGATLLQQMLSQNQRAHEYTQTASLQQEDATLAREVHELNEDKFEQKKQEYADSIDPAIIAQSAAAAETGVLFLPDPRAGGDLVRVPAPGTDDWKEATTQAIAAAEVAEVYNSYAESVATQGVIEDPQEAGFGEQDSLRSQLTFAIKEATKAGALDQGLINETERLTGSAYDNRSFWLGNDVEALGRIASTGKMFEDALTRSQSATRLLTSWDPAEKNRLGTAQQRTSYTREALIPAVQQTISPDFGGTGDVVPKSQSRPGLKGAVAERFAESREIGSVIGSQIDNLLSGLIGFAGGRLGR